MLGRDYLSVSFGASLDLPRDADGPAQEVHVRQTRRLAQPQPRERADGDERGKPVRSCLQRSYGPGSAGLAQILGAAMTYNVEKPSELGMYRMDSRIQSLAESDA
jgi:hypothetical protein